MYEVSVWEDGGYEDGDKRCNCGSRGGDELMNAGLLLDTEQNTKNRKSDFFAELFLLRKR
jgi:hypothetical protein